MVVWILYFTTHTVFYGLCPPQWFFWTAFSCWGKSNSSKATLRQCWSHRHNTILLSFTHIIFWWCPCCSSFLFSVLFFVVVWYVFFGVLLLFGMSLFCVLLLLLGMSLFGELFFVVVWYVFVKCVVFCCCLVCLCSVCCDQCVLFLWVVHS